MTNYEAMISLNQKMMASILDQIYLTGMNAGQADEEENEDFPYGEDWLAQEAEAALFPTDPDDPELLDGLVRAIFQNAGIDLVEGQ